MAKSYKRGIKIKDFILRNIPDNPGSVVALACKEFRVSRQAINRHMKILEAEGLINTKGSTKNRRYELKSLGQLEFNYKIIGLEEDRVWRNDIYPLIADLPENVTDIWHYGCTEMINNAIDHSNGKDLAIYFEWNAVNKKIWIDDDGIGIFKKIKDICGLEDERHAILELAKGKLTTDPEHHTGEGIFFSSRMFDEYIIFSGDVTFSHDFGEEEDWIWEREKPMVGTQVFMRIDNDSPRTYKEIFDKYTARGDDFGFTKTVVPVRLVRHGPEKLISRSQAKRLMARVDRFKTVILDFTDVDSIGQAFADEIFRVFAAQHQDINVRAAFANKSIQHMIKRARNIQTQI